MFLFKSRVKKQENWNTLQTKTFSHKNLECPQCRDQLHCVTCSRLPYFAPILWTCSSHTSLDLVHGFLERNVAVRQMCKFALFCTYEIGETPLEKTDQACSNHVKSDALWQAHGFCDCNLVYELQFTFSDVNKGYDGDNPTQGSPSHAANPGQEFGPTGSDQSSFFAAGMNASADVWSFHTGFGCLGRHSFLKEGRKEENSTDWCWPVFSIEVQCFFKSSNVIKGACF